MFMSYVSLQARGLCDHSLQGWSWHHVVYFVHFLLVATGFHQTSLFNVRKAQAWCEYANQLNWQREDKLDGLYVCQQYLIVVFNRVDDGTDEPTKGYIFLKEKIKEGKA